MATMLAIHEVDDVDHWLASTRRGEFFDSLGITVREFRDKDGSGRVGLILEVPDPAALQAALESPEAGEAMAADGVHPETLVVMVEP